MFRINSSIAIKIILAFALLNGSLYTAFHPSGILRMILILLMNTSGILLVIYFVKLGKDIKVNLYFKTVFILLLIWSLFTFFRSIAPNSEALITLFGHYYAGWTWLTPLAIVFGFNLTNWLKSFSLIGTIIFIVSILGLGSFFYSDSVLWGLISWVMFLPVLLLTFFIQSRKIKIIIPLAIVSYLLISFYASIRINLPFLGLMIMFTFIEYLRLSNINIIKKVIVFSIILIFGLFLSLKFDKLYNSVSSNDEATTDTRTFLFVELFGDMTPTERVIGRGALGTYFSEYFFLLNEQDTGGPSDSSTRFSSEVGYLHMMLKGGYIMVFLHVILLLPTAFLGIFRSQNPISRMGGYLTLSYLLIWTISYSPFFSAEFILLWMAAGSAISESARKTKITI